MTPREYALRYIRATGGIPKIEWFDEDHDPIGPMLRRDMVREGLIFEEGGRVLMTTHGKTTLNALDED